MNHYLYTERCRERCYTNNDQSCFLTLIILPIYYYQLTRALPTSNRARYMYAPSPAIVSSACANDNQNKSDYAEVFVCREKRRERTPDSPPAVVVSPPLVDVTEDEGRGSGVDESVSPVLKSDVNKIERNLEEDPEALPRKWHWNWPDAMLRFSPFPNQTKVIKDRPRYGFVVWRLVDPDDYGFVVWRLLDIYMLNYVCCLEAPSLWSPQFFRIQMEKSRQSRSSPAYYI